MRATDLPLFVQAHHLYAAVEINGAPASLIVDTGAASTLLTSEAVTRLKLPHPIETQASMYGIGGDRSLSSLHTARFSLGGLGGNNLTFSIPFGDKWLGGPGDGLLGMDILSRFELDFDLPARKLILYVPTSGCSAPSAALEQPLFMLPMHQNLGSPNAVIDVEVAGHRLRALLDSGAQASLLFGSATRALGLGSGDNPTDRTLKVAGVGPSIVAGRRHVLERVQVGDLTISNMAVAVTDERVPEDIDMLLGLDFFVRAHLWLSFSSHAVIMQFPPKPSPLAP